MFGLALSVASTVVLLKALQDRDLIDSPQGRIAVGWLVVEDLAMVLTLVLLPALAGLLAPGAQADGAASPGAGDILAAVLVTLGGGRLRRRDASDRAALHPLDAGTHRLERQP